MHLVALPLPEPNQVRMLQACKALGLALEDVVAVCDVMAGRNITGACHALWSVASACVQLGMKA